MAITSLKKIADALNVPITSFFEEYKNNNFLVKKEEQKPFRIEGSTAEYIRVGGEFSGRSLEPMLVTLDPGANSEATKYNHPGEEFYYVLEGTVIFNIDGHEFLVKKGDSIHFPSELTHYWLNPTEQKAKLLCVLIPVIF